MKLYIMRHAKRDFGIHFDRLLTVGIWQAKVTGPWFKDKDIDIVYCSPQKRVRETLKELKPYLKKNIPIKISDSIRQKSSPEEVGADAMKAYNMKVDSFEVVEKRVNSFLKKIKKIHKNKTVLIVSHKEVTRQFIKSILNKYRDVDYEDIPVRSGSIQMFDFDKNGKVKKYFTNKIIYSEEKTKKMMQAFKKIYDICKKKKPERLQEVVRKMDEAQRNYLKKAYDWQGLIESIERVKREDGLR